MNMNAAKIRRILLNRGPHEIHLADKEMFVWIGSEAFIINFLAFFP
jgi:hypothetical protein